MINHNYTFETKEYVQFFLDRVSLCDPINVIFLKKDGTQGQYIGTLMQGDGINKDQVPIQTVKGIKSFNINRVLSINPACG